MLKTVLSTETDVVEHLAKMIGRCAKRALSDSDRFRVGLSGGSVLKYLIAAIPRIDTDLSKWQFFFCDERCVDVSDDESTYGAYRAKLIPKLKLREDQFIWIDRQLPVEECARDYERKILKEFKLAEGEVPSFDLLLLGMGPDGHTCSLFPGHELLKEKTRLIAGIANSPKPPPERVTMTFPLINNAKCCIFTICGEGKAHMVKRVFVEKEQLPAAMVRLKDGYLLGIFDKGAGQYIM